ncbi:MAG: hypothetical protein KF799_11050 [Bdellovibrionales bacterium]|nr:hypothetical protein [Bdellovibrionales bacterium]
MIFRPSGGMLYHWRAWRSRSRWQPFVNALSAWLGEWRTGEELVLIGPSAGYTLPVDFLKRFAKITAYDLDPLAPTFFRRHHRGLAVEFHRQDVFWREARLSLEPLKELLSRHPQAAFLFSNVLGQLLLEGTAEESEWLRFLTDLRRTLGSRDWASYHDVFTYEGGEVIDHLLSGEWKQGLKTGDFEWKLTPRSLHKIQGVRSR